MYSCINLVPKDLPDRPCFTHFQRTVTGAPVPARNAVATDGAGNVIPFAQRQRQIVRPPPKLLEFPGLNRREARHECHKQWRAEQPKKCTEFAARVAARNKEVTKAACEAEWDRILAGPSARMLLERLAEHLPTYMPIAPKAIVIDIDKHSLADLVRIYAPKFNAVLKRLKVFETFDFGDEIGLVVDHVKNLQSLIERLQRIKRELADRCSYIEYRQWKGYEAGCKEIGGISFKGLRCNRVWIVKALSAVYTNGYFN